MAEEGEIETQKIEEDEVTEETGEVEEQTKKSDATLEELKKAKEELAKYKAAEERAKLKEELKAELLKEMTPPTVKAVEKEKLPKVDETKGKIAKEIKEDVVESNIMLEKADTGRGFSLCYSNFDNDSKFKRLRR